MSAAFSNGMLARVAVTMAIGIGAATYGYLGLAESDEGARLTPVLAGAVSYLVAAVTFYVVFGLLAMHWFGRRYWITSAVWGVMWLLAFYLLGREWLEPIGLAFTFLTVMMIGIALPKGGLAVPGEQWKNGGHR